MKKSLMLVVVLLMFSGCSFIDSSDQTQYIVTEEGGKLRPFAIVQYNIFKDGVTAKVILYQKEYLSPSSVPGYMNVRYKEMPPELEKMRHCIVFDKNNFEGELSFINVKMVNGKWAAPTMGFNYVGYLTWKTDVKDLSIEWVEGTKYPKKHLVASYKKNHWLPEEGYEWLLDDKNEVKRDANGEPMVKEIGKNN